MKRLLAFSSLLTLLAALVSLPPAGTVAADSLQDLQAQKQQLEQQATDAQSQANTQANLARNADLRQQQLGGQIQQVSQQVADTQNKIQDTQGQIDQKSQQIDQLLSQERTIQGQLNTLLREIYIYKVSMPDDLVFFSNQPISQREEQQAQFSALNKSLLAVADKTKAAQLAVQAAKDNLEQQRQGLVSLQGQQQNQQAVLADARATQQALQANAIVAEQQLEAQAASAKAKAAALEKKIEALLSENWSGRAGSLAPVADYNWYYTQQDPRWANDTLGYSGYTVGGFGCLITSLAMLARRDGNGAITPQYIADHGSFLGSGDYVSGPGGIGEYTVGASWSAILRGISTGNLTLPLIIRLNLSSFYTHFVVLYAVNGNHFSIQDPWNPSGSGYSTSLVSGYGVVSGL
ncbi:hypothetical protein KGQ71_03565 [Patescibacteria group bacterium]|nr:hypothetical protein [Patescibacteria group bacterium]